MTNNRTIFTHLHWLAAALLILAFMISIPALAGDQQLPGTWRVAGTPDTETGIPPFVNFARIQKDGTIINTDPSEGAAVGHWQQLGGGNYLIEFYGFTELGGTTFQFKVSALVSQEDNNSFSGPFETEVSFLNGLPAGGFTGVVEATRL